MLLGLQAVVLCLMFHYGELLVLSVQEPFVKIDSENLTEHAHRAIKRYILSGQLTTESRLTEEQFAKQLGISKSPIREAFNTLQCEGFLRIEPRRGAYVRRFTAQEVADLYDLREALEVFAAANARITPELASSLRESVERTSRLVKENRKPEHIEEDIRFHQAIVAATGNQELMRVHNTIQNKLWLCRCQTYRLTSPDTPVSHHHISEAIAAGDRAGAEEATRQHIRTVRDMLVADLKRAQEEKHAEAGLAAAMA